MTMTAVAELLAHSLSPDPAIRHDAEQQLVSLAADFQNYMAMLCQELSNEQGRPEVRTAAGIALKNALTAKDEVTRAGLYDRWLAIDGVFRAQIKQTLLQTLSSATVRAGGAAAQAIAAVAEIELPNGQWDQLFSYLKTNMSSPDSNTRECTLQAIGYVCETLNPKLLASQADGILTVVVKGAQKDEPNARVRIAALTALNHSLEFIEANFEREGDRNYIMMVVCEAATAPDANIQEKAFECLCNIVQIYYSKMQLYMQEALYGLTLQNMASENTNVALQAMEFWSTVCEEESSILQQNQSLSESDKLPFFGFAKSIASQLTPHLLFLMTKKEEDDDEDEWNVPMAAATCLSLLASVIETDILSLVVPWVENHINSTDWHYREAAVMAFGSILDGPDPNNLTTLLDHPQVKDTTAWALGRICEVLTLQSIKPDHLRALVAALIDGLAEPSKVATNCAWCILNLAEFASDDLDVMQTYKLSEYFQHLITALLQSVDASRPTGRDANARATVYEAIANLVGTCAKDCFPIVTELAAEMVKRLQATIEMQSQLVNADDRSSLQELQGNLCSVLTSVVRRMGKLSLSFTDQIMLTVLHLLSGASRSSTVIEDAFMVVSAIAGAADQDFNRYMPEFHPHLKAALQNPQESQLSNISVGVVGDVSRALTELFREYTDDYMNLLALNLQSPLLDQNVKPTILSTFGDIAIALSGDFSAYVQQVMLIINEVVAKTTMMSQTEEQYEYANVMREGILEAYVGIVHGLGPTPAALAPHLGAMFSFMESIVLDPNHYDTSDIVMAGLAGDVAEAFPPGQLKALYSAPWIEKLLQSLKASFQRFPNSKAQEAMRWLRNGLRKQKAVGTI
ncbi:armadillo-type protein [Zopfochytrium polystomum]|nr:armadillo-type protein [Zopfochytrium polystomum]